MAQGVISEYRAYRCSLHKLVFLCAALTLNSCYLVKQGYFQGQTLLSATPIAQLTADPETDPKLLEKFRELEAILRFAKQSGLDVGGSYQKYIHHQGRFVSYLVQAAYPDRLEAVTWWFPVVGSVPYLGFFHKEDRENAVLELRDAGFDIHRGYASAFSGLGYFEDPVFSSMLRRERVDLAHLIFHELTHRTLWLPGSVRFNENLAEFVGEQLSERYLEGHQQELVAYRAKRANNRLYRKWLRDLRGDLRSLYRQSALDRAYKLRQKELIFQKYKTEKLPKFNGHDYDWIARRRWNNAAVLAASLYSPDTDKFRQAYECMGARNFGEYFSELKRIAKRGLKGPKILGKVCERGI